MEQKIGNSLSKEYWIGGDVIKEKRKPKVEKTINQANCCALITALVTDSFPELEHCSEKQFMDFQNKLASTIAKICA